MRNDAASLPGWLQQWHVAIKTRKSKVICFSRRSTDACQPLSFGRKHINLRRSVKYLGVRLDRLLAFNNRVNNTLNKACSDRIKLFSMFFRRGPLAVRTRLTTYLRFSRMGHPPCGLSCRRPTSVVWNNSNPELFAPSWGPVVCQNAVIRPILRETLSDFVRDLAFSFLSKAGAYNTCTSVQSITRTTHLSLIASNRLALVNDPR